MILVPGSIAWLLNVLMWTVHILPYALGEGRGGGGVGQPQTVGKVEDCTRSNREGEGGTEANQNRCVCVCVRGC